MDDTPRYILNYDPLSQELNEGFRAGLKKAIADLKAGKQVEDLETDLNVNYHYDGYEYEFGFNRGLQFAIKVIKGECNKWIYIKS